ncbi:MAG: ABC transporter [Ruminococcus sp.]|nr:ABC transporter [Ruminococcus sp.]
MGAIFRRDLLGYFTSPVGYIFLGVFYAVSGFFFYSSSISAGSTDLSQLFVLLYFALLVLVPILTMRSFSEEKKQKTEQCILTAPVSLGGIVAGKFLSAFVVYLIGISCTVVYAVTVSFFAQPDWNVVLGNIMGLVLLGASFVALGIFISSLTENQMVAAILSMVLILALYILQVIANYVSVEWIATALTSIAFSSRYQTFTAGILDFSNVLFFVSATVIFLFLTVRVLEKRRWG